jgi:hypothetical protein
MANNRDIKYFNRDFTGLKELLIDFSKTYYPSTYTDFSPTSPGMMFIEMAAYVGDILSFYLDTQIQETYLTQAKQRESLYDLAYMLGYKPQATKAATVTVDIYQQVPAKLSGSTYIPDYDYAVVLQENTQIKSAVEDQYFVIQDITDFTVSSSFDPTEVSVYQISGTDPQYYLLKKTRKAISGQIQTQNFSFTSPQAFTTVTLPSTNIIQVIDVTDSEGNKWYEVPYLGQELVYTDALNTGESTYTLQLEKKARRFTTRLQPDNTIQIQFGAGTTADSDESIIPNPDNVGLGLPYGQTKLTTAYSPTNFLYTNTYGIAPSNTTLTVRYLTGGGIGANVEAGVLTTVINPGNIVFKSTTLNPATANYIFSTVAVTNPERADGGGNADTDEDIRQNTLAAYQSQLRAVTPEDYLIRALSLPARYGSIAKAFIAKTPVTQNLLQTNTTPLTLYVLGYTKDKKLTTTTQTVKENLGTYLSLYTGIGDRITITDGFVINIGVYFEITIRAGYISSTVLLSCLTQLKNYFNIDKQQFNQPIQLRDLYLLLDTVPGVQTVKKLEITNKSGVETGYSEYAYDLTAATQDGVIYPSLDPMIFEVKYPDTDISGRVVSI